MRPWSRVVTHASLKYSAKQISQPRQGDSDKKTTVGARSRCPINDIDGYTGWFYHDKSVKTRNMETPSGMGPQACAGFLITHDLRSAIIHGTNLELLTKIHELRDWISEMQTVIGDELLLAENHDKIKVLFSNTFKESEILFPQACEELGHRLDSNMPVPDDDIFHPVTMVRKSTSWCTFTQNNTLWASRTMMRVVRKFFLQKCCKYGAPKAKFS